MKKSMKLFALLTLVATFFVGLVSPQVASAATKVDKITVGFVPSRNPEEIVTTPTDKTDGVAIVGIKKGSAAEQAGLKQYDVITKVGDQAVTNYLDLRSALFHHSVGEKVDVVVLRDGKETTVSVTLGEEPERQFSQSNGVPAQTDGSEDSPTNGAER